MAFPGSSDFPLSADALQSRIDHVDINFAQDVNFLWLQVQALQAWLLGRETARLRTMRYDYLQGAAPDHEVSLGTFTLDTTKIHPSSELRARCMVNSTFSVPGYTRVHIDDLGPVGAPAAPVRITANAPSGFSMEATASGLVVLTTDPFVLGSGVGFPGVGQIATGHRMYDIVVLQTSVAGDTVDVGFAELFEEV